jgi:drug/metabolite transporter (DMT)-like permease
MNTFPIFLVVRSQFSFAFTYLKSVDIVSIIHPALAVAFVFPIIGMAVNFAWQTRQRRLQTASGEKSKIPPVVGREHVEIGRWLTASVVGVTLVALAYSVVYGSGGFIDQQKQGQLANFQAILVLFMFIATLASLVLLYRARAKLWRAIFATLSGMGLIILGAQDGVYRLGNEWYWSHYYYGIVVSLLMIFSLAIVEDIYKDRANRWRNVHIILNCLALLLFIGQGITGARDLLEVPLSWQKPAVYGCNFQQKKCTKSAIPDRNNPSVALIKK